MKKLLLLLLIIFNNLLFAATNINIISSFSILGDIIKQIGGDKVTVINIVKDNASIHSYKISPEDIKKIYSSNIIFINGLSLENSNVLHAIENSKIPYIEVTKGITPIVVHGDIINLEYIKKLKPEYHANHKHYVDPHIWQDPILVIKYSENIANTLIKLDPSNKNYYINNLKQYTKKLEDLDFIIRNNFSTIANNKRNILISHDYLNYFARRYNINIISVKGLSEDSQVSAKKISEIVRLVKDKNIKAIFIENIGNKGIINQIAKESNRNISGKLYTDALSSESGPASNYLDMIKYNSNQIYNALK